jgi:serralysin
VHRRTVRFALTALLGVVLAAATALGAGAASGSAAQGGDERRYGPPYRFTTELVGQYPGVKLKDQAMLYRSKHGYLFRTGQQHSRLTITQVDGRVRFVDRGTERFKKLGQTCRRQRVRVGIAAVCRIPRDVTVRRPLLIEVWPRLGNDFTDGSTLSARFALAVLGDRGNDRTLLGAGPDFFNGYTGRDRVSGGAGNEWVRLGAGDDPVWGGAGHDLLIGMDGQDTIYGGSGEDRLNGMAHNDRIHGQAGQDLFLCGTGYDRAWGDGSEDYRQCEAIDRG